MFYILHLDFNQLWSNFSVGLVFSSSSPVLMSTRKLICGVRPLKFLPKRWFLLWVLLRSRFSKHIHSHFLNNQTSKIVFFLILSKFRSIFFQLRHLMYLVLQSATWISLLLKKRNVITISRCGTSISDSHQQLYLQILTKDSVTVFVNAILYYKVPELIFVLLLKTLTSLYDCQGFKCIKM